MHASLEHLDEDATSNNITRLIMKTVQKVFGLEREDIAARFVAFGAGLCTRHLSCLHVNIYVCIFSIHENVIHVSSTCYSYKFLAS
jgi:hypothetical protein